MKIGRGETNHLFCDVDGTLLMWPAPGRPGAPTPAQRLNAQSAVRQEGCNEALMPALNKRLISEIKKWLRASRANALVIWSMGGAEHAMMACQLCEFDPDRVICIAKPDLAIDDNPHVWGKRGVLVETPDAFKVPA